MSGFGMDYQGGGGGGGGFDRQGSSQDNNSSQEQQQKPRRNYDEQTLTPVTIHMALEATLDGSGDGSVVSQDGRKLSSVVIVGAVRNFSNQSTNITYELEDGTGLLPVKKWADDNDCSAILELREKTFKDSIYVKVIGQIKDYQGNRSLVASSVRPLSTGNELTHHMLSVIHSGIKHKAADSIVPPNANMMMANNNRNNDGVGFGQTIGDSSGFNSGTGNPKHDRALEIIRNVGNTEEAGCHISQLVEAMGDVPEPEVRSIVQSLSDNGEIYSTTTEELFRVAS